MVNSKTRTSRPISFARGKVAGKFCNANLVPQDASNKPSPPPARANNMLSVSNWRTILPRAAPSAARTANSRVLPVERAISKLATFTQAIRSTNPTAASRTSRSGRKLPTICSLRGMRVAPMPVSASGYAAAKSPVTRFMSARAC